MYLEQELSEDLIPCEFGETRCWNSPKNSRCPKCSTCTLSPVYTEQSAPPLLTSNYWHPIAKGLKHPIVEQRKRRASAERRAFRATVRQSKDIRRRAVAKYALGAERLTEKVITSTANSGRKNKDGDHVSFGVTLDTKHQSQRVNPVINWDELDKVRRDAQRGGNAVGGLVLHSPHRAAVVIALEDWATLMRQVEDGRPADINHGKTEGSGTTGT